MAASLAYVDNNLEVTEFLLSLVLERRLETPLSAKFNEFRLLSFMKSMELRLLPTEIRFLIGDFSIGFSAFERWNETGRLDAVPALKLRIEERFFCGELVPLEAGVTGVTFEITDEDRTRVCVWSLWS
ncbi:hypothetical protein OGAPHI_002351 [Ogataea philodendri]|uniref:Uncharacterized protein n=1 Tax=Ogataea philodendri TaxID=1378263 RepID=A0A9P8PAV5_9ASCO|nr:uncharacterized protein OGAPHI_002351 [Ogataea philodendri]KAH3668597.1 hypothetical protein OGAPHI_002351 [Ogataea philodendri]